MRSILFIKLLFVTGLFSLNASASLIERDYLGVTGGVTYDTESQLEWLDLSFTRTMDFNEYQDYDLLMSFVPSTTFLRLHPDLPNGRTEHRVR